MRYFIITSGPAEGTTFEMPDDATENDVRKEAFRISPLDRHITVSEGFRGCDLEDLEEYEEDNG